MPEHFLGSGSSNTVFANCSFSSILLGIPELTWIAFHILMLSILRGFWSKFDGGPLGMSLFAWRNSESKGFLVFYPWRYAKGWCSSTLLSVMPESYSLKGTPSDSDCLELADSSLTCAVFSFSSSYMTPSRIYSSCSLGDSFSSSFNSLMIGPLLKNDLKLLMDWLRLLGID